jgi:hypothetical protein
MKTYGGVEVGLYAYLVSALRAIDRDEWLASVPVWLLSMAHSHKMGVCVDSKAGLDAVGKRRESTPNSMVIQPIIWLLLSHLRRTQS